MLEPSPDQSVACQADWYSLDRRYELKFLRGKRFLVTDKNLKLTE